MNISEISAASKEFNNYILWREKLFKQTNVLILHTKVHKQTSIRNRFAKRKRMCMELLFEWPDLLHIS